MTALRNVSIALILATIAAPAGLAQGGKTKLAVVDVGGKVKAPPAFLDFLAVAFTKQANIALLERAEIDRLLREQALSLSLSRDAAVKAGKLWAVDAFLMLEAEGQAKGPMRIRTRLVDAHHGMKVFDIDLIVAADSKRYPEQADALAKSAAQKLATFRKDAKDVRLVGVAAIQSKEVSKSWDWLSESLAAGIEQHLGLEPRVILMERKQTRPLTDERNLADGLPEALKASAVLVTGSFQLDRAKGLDAIAVQVQCRSAGKVILEKRVEGSLNQPGLIAQKLAKEISAGLSGGVSTRSMTADAEAKMLADQARAFFSRESWTNDPEQALAPAEAALALVPTSNEYRYLLLTILDAQLSYRSFLKDRAALWQHTLAYCTRALPLAEQIVAKPDKSLPFIWPSTVTKIFTHHYTHHFGHVRDKEPGSLEDDDAAKGVRAGLRALHARGMASPALRAYFMEPAGKIGFVWCDTPEQAFELMQQSFEACSEEFKRVPNSIVMSTIGSSPHFYLHFSRCPQWAKRPDLDKTYAKFIDETCRHKDPIVRIAGELRGTAFYNREPGPVDREKSRTHYRNFLRVLTEEVQPKWPTSPIAYSSWTYLPLANARFAVEDKKDAEIKAALLRESLDYFLAEPKRFHRLGFWRSSIDAYAQHLDTMGKPEEAYRYLQDHATRLKTVKLTPGDNTDTLTNALATLARKHPRLRPVDTGPNPYKTEAVVLARDLSKFFAKQPWNGGSVNFRRVILEGKVAAIVCTHGLGRKERFGLLRLDPDTLKPMSFTEYPIDLETKSKWPFDHHIWYGPPVAVSGEDVYVGSPYGGIIGFPADGPAKGWSEKTGLASDMITSLAVLDGKLYAATGAYWTDRGLIELDLASGKSAVVFSSKAADSKHMLDGRGILGVAADAKRGCLWLATSTKPAAKDKGALFAYYPKDGKAVKKMDAERGLDWLEPRNGMLLMGAVPYALSLDFETEKITALISSDPAGYIPFKPARQRPFGGFSGNRVMLPVGKNLIYVDRKNPYTGSLSAMTEGDASPASIIEKCFPTQPDRHVIKDLTMSRQGLLLLTLEGLHRAPGVKADGEKRPG